MKLVNKMGSKICKFFQEMDQDNKNETTLATIQAHYDKQNELDKKQNEMINKRYEMFNRTIDEFVNKDLGSST
jgi:hypothetical protein